MINSTLLTTKASGHEQHCLKAMTDDLEPEVSLQEIAGAARDDLLLYVQLCNPGYIVGRLHEFLAAKLEAVANGKIKRLIVTCPPRHGKQVADSVPVLTTKGWKKHGDLKAGDMVFSPTGHPVRVMAVSDPTNEKMAVELSNGETFKVHPNHEWLARDRDLRGSARQWRVVETREMAGKEWKVSPGKRGSRARFHLPGRSALVFPEAKLPMPPYALGVWLGDGTTGKACITKAASDSAVWERVAACGYKISAKWTHATTGVVTISFGDGSFKADLNAAGVLRSKRIPEAYLRSSIRQRLELLAGLMDSDGHCEEKSGRCRIVTTNRELRDGMFDLCASLGFQPYITAQAPATTSSGVVGRMEVFTVGFQPDRKIPASLKRRTPSVFKRQKPVRICRVSRCASEPGRCIQVDSLDGLYLIGKTLTPTHNSQLISIEFPTWLLGRSSDKKIVLGSYAQGLAQSHSKAARNRMQSDEYQSVFATRIADGDGAANEWKTAQDGMYKAVGVGSGLTGRGCLPPKTLILTSRGSVPIEDVASSPSSCKVLSYDAKHSRLVWRKVKAVSRREADGLYRITTASGRVVEATEEHPFFTSERYSPASELAAGQPLLCAVPNPVCDGGIQRDEEHLTRNEGVLLRQPVRLPALQREAGIQAASVSELWGGTGTNEAVVFGGLPVGTLCKGKIVADVQVAGFNLQPVQPGFQAEDRESGLLQPWLRECSSRAENDGGWKSGVAQRDEPATATASLRQSVPDGARENIEPGWIGVRGVRPNGEIGGSPHQHESIRQQVGESGDSVRGVSHDLAWGGAFKTEEDSVALVERIREPSVVFNLQVEGDENYFANGILTHNCDILLIDDPVKDFQEAHSPTIRENVWNWFWSVAYTRLHPGAAVIILMTRWHDDDLVGRMLKPDRMREMNLGDEDSSWDVVNIPAICDEPDDPLKRQLGDPLFPERYPIEKLKSIRVNVGSYVWSALYCGRPTVRGGNYIKVGKLRTVDLSEVPTGLRWVRYWDLATSEKEAADFTASVAGARGPDGTLYLRDGVNVKLEWPDARGMIKTTADAERFPVGIEAVGGFKTAFANLLEVMRPDIICREYNVTRDKLTRALPWIAMVEAGKVALVRGDWVMDFVVQAEAFPGGKNDDYVDAVSGVWTMIQSVFEVSPPLLADRFNRVMATRRTRALSG